LSTAHGLLQELVLLGGGGGVELGAVDRLGGDQRAHPAVLATAEVAGGEDVLQQAALQVAEVLGPGQGDRGRHRLEQPLLVRAGGDLAVDVEQVVDGVGVLLQRLARRVERAVAVRGSRPDVLFALLLVQLDAWLDGEVRRGDGLAVDRPPLLAEPAELVQAVLDLLAQQRVVALEPLRVGAVAGGDPVDGAALGGQGGPPLRAAAVDVGERQAALALQLVDQRGEPGGQAGEGVAPGGPGALCLVGADADRGEDGEHEEWTDQGDDELRSNWDIPQHRPHLVQKGEGAGKLPPTERRRNWCR
jgi:hypothetical protein